MMDQDTPGETTDTPIVPEQEKPLYMARLRRQLATSLFRLGPIPLGIIGAVIITLLALLYLNEVGLANQARLRLQQLANQQTQLQQQNQQLLSQQGYYQSPAYIEDQARRLGMQPEDPSNVPTIIIPGEPR